ncbi:2019_t:CDS:2 [Entrophospora sp. SA101]|nr:2019_t:CDS:2 [Entrophospora sp. SA101]
MQDPKNSSNISGSSFIDLKAEIFKYKEDFKRKKELAGKQPGSEALKKPEKRVGLWDRQNKGINERLRKDELEIVESSTLEASRKAMERKAKLYDQLVKTGIDDDTLADEVLVDFDRKAWEIFSATGSETTTKSVPVKANVILEDELMEQLREKWEENALEELKQIRTKGVGFYRFSKDEQEREEQMNALKQLRDETETKRSESQSVKDKRKAQIEARKALLVARKRFKPIIIPIDTKSKYQQQLGLTLPTDSQLIPLSYDIKSG